MVRRTLIKNREVGSLVNSSPSGFGVDGYGDNFFTPLPPFYLFCEVSLKSAVELLQYNKV